MNLSQKIFGQVLSHFPPFAACENLCHVSFYFCDCCFHISGVRDHSETTVWGPISNCDGMATLCARLSTAHVAPHALHPVCMPPERELLREKEKLGTGEGE